MEVGTITIGVVPGIGVLMMNEVGAAPVGGTAGVPYGVEVAMATYPVGVGLPVIRACAIAV